MIPRNSFPAGYFNSDKHPRGYHGRFAGSIGKGSNAHAMRVRRARPSPEKTQHAVVPHIRGVRIQGPMGPVTNTD